MESKMNLPVDVICYGNRTHFNTRLGAVSFYRDCMRGSEGAERERYAKIYFDLTEGDASVVSDGSSERKATEKATRYTLADKSKILHLIETDRLNIRSPELYDFGKCVLLVEDRDIVKALLKQDGWYAAQFLRKYIENDKDLLLAVATGGDEIGNALGYASEQLQDDKEFVLELVKVNASDVRYVSDRLSNDPEIIATALEHAEDDFDIESIKQTVGTELLSDMVKNYLAVQRDKAVAPDKNEEVGTGAKLYDVTITETLQMTVQVEAYSTDEAEWIVADNWRAGEYILDADHYAGVEFSGKACKDTKELSVDEQIAAAEKNKDSAHKESVKPVEREDR